MRGTARGKMPLDSLGRKPVSNILRGRNVAVDEVSELACSKDLPTEDPAGRVWLKDYTVMLESGILSVT